MLYYTWEKYVKFESLMIINYIIFCLKEIYKVLILNDNQLCHFSFRESTKSFNFQ